MTDKEIIKALGTCNRNDSCSKCPYDRVRFGAERDCVSEMTADALALINRQQAEIERLEDTLKIYHKYNPAIRHAKFEATKEFAESIKAEIREALKSNYKAKSEIMAKPNIDMAYEFISYCEGKIAALRGIDDFVDTLISGETKTADSDFPKDYSYGY